MSIEHYAVFRASPGSVADEAAKQIIERRKAARKARAEFCDSIGAVALWGNERCISAAVFAADKALPVGWRGKPDLSSPDGVVAVPDKKKPEGKNLVFTLRSVPALPGAEEFTALIGGDCKIVRRYLRWCLFERHGDTLFVLTPFHPKADTNGLTDENAAADQVFVPEGCVRVPLSVYYAAKEAAADAAAIAKAEMGANAA